MQKDTELLNLTLHNDVEMIDDEIDEFKTEYNDNNIYIEQTRPPLGKRNIIFIIARLTFSSYSKSLRYDEKYAISIRLIFLTTKKSHLYIGLLDYMISAKIFLANSFINRFDETIYEC